MATVICLHGSPACGKLTIAKELSKIINYKLFHNHLTVDLLLSIFDFGSPNFIKYRQEIWLSLIGDAVKEGSNLIFTFNPENTVDTNFPQLLEQAIVANGGKIIWVEIACPLEVLLERMDSDSRKECKKLVSKEFYLQLLEAGTFAFPPLPVNHTVDSSLQSPQESAVLIAKQLKIDIVK